MGQAFLMLISLLENYRMAGLFMRGPWALYPTIIDYPCIYNFDRAQ